MSHDFNIPADLTPRGREAAQLILAKARELLGADLSGGGCRAFYSPEEWKARGEAYGHTACLVVAHDGGDLAPLFNMDYCAYNKWEAMFAAMMKVGFLPEQATSWYTCIYDEG